MHGHGAGTASRREPSRFAHTARPAGVGIPRGVVDRGLRTDCRTETHRLRAAQCPRLHSDHRCDGHLERLVHPTRALATWDAGYLVHVRLGATHPQSMDGTGLDLLPFNHTITHAPLLGLRVSVRNGNLPTFLDGSHTDLHD